MPADVLDTNGLWNCVNVKILLESRTFYSFGVVLFCFGLVWFLVFRDRVSLCSPGCPGTHFVDQAGFELRNLPASASQVLGLKCEPPQHLYLLIY